MIAQLIIGGFTLPLVDKFGRGNAAKGWQMTIGLWAVLCVVLFVVTFLSTRERIQPDQRQELAGKQDFRNLLRNGPWIAMFIVTLAHFIVAAMRGGTVLYFFKYYVDQDRLFSVLQSLGLTQPADGGAAVGLWHGLLSTFGLMVDPARTNTASVGFSLFNMSSQFITVIGVLCATYLSIRFGKKSVVQIGFALTAIFMSCFIFLPANAVWATFGLEYLRALAFAPTIPLLWAMFADVVDYAEWKTGRRTTGVIYATIMFGLKAGLSLGGAMAGKLLNLYGYVPNVPQTAQALLGIRMTIAFTRFSFSSLSSCACSFTKLERS
jgi:glycoside/pentoside/hexuronide:cation symporter, GPH family